MRILIIFIISYAFTLGIAFSQARFYPNYEVRTPPSDGVQYHRQRQVYRTRLLERIYKFKTRIPRPEEKEAQKRIQAKLKDQHFRQQQILREKQKQKNLEFGRQLALKQAKVDSQRPIRQSQAIKNNVKTTSIAVKNALLRMKKREIAEKKQSSRKQNILHPKPAHIPYEFRVR